jgi:hypothetical protein
VCTFCEAVFEIRLKGFLVRKFAEWKGMVTYLHLRNSAYRALSFEPPLSLPIHGRAHGVVAAVDVDDFTRNRPGPVGE